MSVKRPNYVAPVNIHEDVPDSFPLSRMLHCHNVGLRMASYAKKHLGWDDVKCNDMYILGMMHDLGYELNPDPFNHDEAMSEALGHTGYKYMNEIAYHSRMQNEFDTPEMRLLYFADMTVDARGKWCTIDERLKDLEERHGKDSDVYRESVDIANALEEWGFDDNVTKDDFITSLQDLNVDDRSTSHKPKSSERELLSIDYSEDVSDEYKV